MLQPKSQSISPSLTAKANLLTPEEAVEIAKRYYGIGANAHALSGEKDSNFHMVADTGLHYLLKVINPAEDASVTNMHTMALRHVEGRDPAMPVQRVIPSLLGEPDFEIEYKTGDHRMVRLVSFTQGALQRKTEQTSRQRRNIGATLARLQEALQDFRHPAEDHFSTWDIKNTLSLKPMINEISDTTKRAELLQWIDLFEHEVLPKVPSLRTQIVHNDLNSDNVVVDPADTDRVVGIIDFGDMVRTPIIFDVAVAAAYQLTDADDPMVAACDFLSGFHGRRRLLPEEADLLFTTIVARMVMRIAITEWRATRFPENRIYILRNTPKAWLQFHRLAEIPHSRAADMFARALSL